MRIVTDGDATAKYMLSLLNIVHFVGESVTCFPTVFVIDV